MANELDAMVKASCGRDYCRQTDCACRVVAVADRWYITMGHSGFNSPANNRDGYASRDSAIAASLRYSHR